ncbi:DUF6809 family protein [Oceanobacillus caeni]
MSRISIVPFDNIVKIYRDSHHRNDMEALNHLEIAYEQGMVEVLKELAYLKLLHFENQGVNYTPKQEKAIEEYEQVYSQALSLCENEQQRSAIMEVCDASNNCSALDVEKSFIDGFILGYSFLKEIS